MGALYFLSPQTQLYCDNNDLHHLELHLHLHPRLRFMMQYICMYVRSTEYTHVAAGV